MSIQIIKNSIMARKAAPFIAKKYTVQDSLGNGTLSMIPDQYIGMGYNDTTQIGSSTFCVDDRNVTLHGKGISVISFGSSMNFIEMQNDLNIDISGDLSISKFSGGFTAQYAKSIQDTGYSISYSFVYKIILPTQVLRVNKFGPDALSDFGQGAFKEGLDRFKAICGNKFIVQEFSGARLYTTLKVVFDSKYDKNVFSVNFHGSLADLGSAALDIQNVAQSHSISGSIELSAIQEGGNVMRLAGIFGKTDDNYILQCRLKPNDDANKGASIEECQKVISDIINYAKQDFTNQIQYNNSGDAKITGVPTSLGYTYLEYDKIGIDAYADVTADVIAIRRHLSELDDEMLELNSYLKTLLYTNNITGVMEYVITRDNPNLIPTWAGKWYWEAKLIDIIEKANLQASYVSVNNILNALESQYNGAIQCYKYPENCAHINDTINSVVEANPIANNIIAFFNTAYVLNAGCDGTNYGLRFLLPIGQKGDTSYYFEKSDFYFANNINGTVPDITLTNIYGIKLIHGTEDEGATLIFGDSLNCGNIQLINPGDLIPVYSGAVTNPDCATHLCPKNTTQEVIVTFYEVESPI